MALLASLGFIVIAGVFWLISLLAIVRIGFGRLESAKGIEGDGIPPGSRALSWSLNDTRGQTHRSPDSTRTQLLVFADHSLESFPGVVDGLNRVSQDHGGSIDVVVLARARIGLDPQRFERMGLDVPVVFVDQHFYDKYNVRVMPYCMRISSAGNVEWRGLVQHESHVHWARQHMVQASEEQSV